MKNTFKFFPIVLLICGVFGVDADEVKRVTLMEGDSVTLNSDVTETQRIFLIQWWFGDKGSSIAQITGNAISYPSHIDTFTGKLQLDPTGSLTIKNMRTKHSGLYKLQIDLNSGSSYMMKFNVTVYESPSVVDADKAEVKSVSVTEGDPVILQTDVTETLGDELIVWRFGDVGKLIAKHDIEAKSLTNYADERFRDRLMLDEKTGSLNITNSRTTDSGLYTVKISSNKQTSYKRFIVTVNDSGLSPGAVAGIVVVLLMFAAAAAAAGVIYYRRKISELESQKFKTVPVKEGDDVTLNTDVTEIQKDDLIEWRSGDGGPPIAALRGGITQIYDTDLDERFTVRLKLDKKTGSLTIKNSRNTDSGHYQLMIRQGSKIKYKMFNVSVCVKEVSVLEGDDVPLNTDVTEIQKDDLIEWRSGDGGPPIAALRGGIVEIYYTGIDESFTDRLKLDKKTGSLTIKNSINTDSGLYQLMIRQGSKIKYKMFKVSVCEKTLSVFEGDPVILKTDAELQRDDVIEWSFGDKAIAELRGGIISTHDDVADGMFRDRLKLDEKTGSLTITNSEVKHAGDYKLQITSNSGDSCKTFRVTVRTRNISVEEGKNLILKPETEIQKNDQIQWRFGDKEIVIAEVRGGTGETHDADERFRGRLMLDEKTGSLIIRDITAEQSGEYKLQIINSRGTTNKRFVVTVNPKMIRVTEGKPVTLETNTEMQKDDQIQWRFGDIIIAEIRGGTRGKTHDDDVMFRNRLTLDEKTGSLTFARTRKEHNGAYELQIISSRGTTNKTFIVIASFYGYTPERVLDGENVTLSSDTFIVKDEIVKWLVNNKIIATGTDGEISYCDEIFKDRLELDPQTGSLTIKNTRTSDSGDYHLKLSTFRIERRFRVTVNKRNISVKEGNNVILKPDSEIQKDDQIQWMFRDILIAELRGGTGGKTHDDGVPDGRFRGRLKLDEKTGSLTITDIKQSGEYKLQIISSRGTTNKTFAVTVFNSEGNRVNDSATVQMPPVDEEDPDGGNKQEGMSLLVR